MSSYFQPLKDSCSQPLPSCKAGEGLVSSLSEVKEGAFMLGVWLKW